MKDLFTAAQQRLSTEVPALRMVDWDLGQLAQEELPDLSYPAALIKVEETDQQALGRYQTAGPATLYVTLAFRVFERTHSIAEDQWRAKGLEHLDTLHAAKWALQGYSGPAFSALNYRSGVNTERADLRIYLLSFECETTDTAPADKNKYIPWPDAGGTGAGPDLCLEDEQDNSLLR